MHAHNISNAMPFWGNVPFFRVHAAVLALCLLWAANGHADKLFKQLYLASPASKQMVLALGNGAVIELAHLPSQLHLGAKLKARYKKLHIVIGGYKIALTNKQPVKPLSLAALNPGPQLIVVRAASGKVKKQQKMTVLVVATPLATPTPQSPPQSTPPTATETPSPTPTSTPSAATTPTATATATPSATPVQPDSSIKLVNESLQYKFQADDFNWGEKQIKVIDPESQQTKSYDQTFSQYGGYPKAKHAATGQFYVTKLPGGRWSMIDPLGFQYFDRAINSVNPGVVDDASKPFFNNSGEFEQLYGDSAGWAMQTSQWLRAIGISSVGNWSTVKTLSAVPTEQRVNYYTSWDCLAALAQEKGWASIKDGNLEWHYKGVPNLVPLFNPELEQSCREKLQDQIGNGAAHPEDPHWIGMFTGNEWPLAGSMLSKYLQLPPTDPNFKAAKSWLQANGATPSSYGPDEKDKFLTFALQQFGELLATIRDELAPGVMLMSPRLHGDYKFDPAVWKGLKKGFDIIAVNYYGAVEVPCNSGIAKLARDLDVPYAISEFYAKGQDTPEKFALTNLAGAGVTVPKQKDRGLYYQGMFSSAISCGNVVSLQWHRYMDNNPGEAGNNPFNDNANKGFVNIFWEPYGGLITRVRQVNYLIYELVNKLSE